MCLQIKKIRHLNNKPKVAKDDIVCYKMFKITENGLESPFMHTKWDKGNIINSCITADSFQTTPKFGTKGTRFVDKGLHSFRHLPYSDNPYERFKNRYMFPGCIVVMCVIPAGSRYWIGTDNDYCSEKLWLMY